jgi:hypothetical protein
MDIFSLTVSQPLPARSSRLSIVYRRCEKRPQTARDKKAATPACPPRF